MIKKIDAVLERVREPESNLTIAQLGLVKRLRYSEKHNKLTVFMNSVLNSHKYCCTIMQGCLLYGTIKSLTGEFQKEFPDLSIEFV